MDSLLSVVPMALKTSGRQRWDRWTGLVLVGVVLSGCGGGGGGNGDPTGPSQQPPPGGSATTVVIQDNLFNPSSRTVAAGTTVRWVNNGAVAHNTTSTTGVWASSNLNPTGEFQRTFSTAGSFPYVCTLHAGMTGTIVVTE